MRKNIVVITGLAGVILGTVVTLIFLSQSPFQKQEQKLFSAHTTLEIFSGPVSVKQSDSQDFQDVSNGFYLKAGMEVKTSDSGRAQIVFPNGTVTRMDTNTTVKILEDSASPQHIKVQIGQGHVWSRVAKMSSSEYYETVSNSVVTRVKGTSFGHYKLSDGSDKVITTKGEVIGECLNNSQQSVISKDNKVLFDCQAGKKESDTISQEDVGDDWFQFNAAEDTNLNERFGPYVYNDSEESLLSKINPKKAFQKTSEAIGSVLGLNTQDTDTDTPVPSVTPTLTPTLSPTPTTIQSSNPSNGSTNNPQKPVPSNTTAPTKTPVPTNPPSVIQPNAIAQIRTSSNGVTISDSVNGNNKAATTNTKVYPGSTVSTNSTSKAEIVFSNGSVTRLDSSTSVTVTDNSGESFDVSILIDAGRIWSRIKKLTGSGENYDTQTDSMVATVRGTSYGHEKDVLDGEPVDKIITVEGEVEGSCIPRNGQRSDQEDSTISVSKNQKGIFKCLKANPELIRDEIVNIEPDDVQWTLENMYLDSQLERSNPEVDYYDPGAAPIDLAEVRPELSVTSQGDASLTAPLKLRGKITYRGLPFKPEPNIVWTQAAGPRCFNNQPCIIFTKLTSLNTQAIFLKEGQYTIRLSSYDHPIFGLNSTDVVVNVTGGNEAPVVTVMDDQDIMLFKSPDIDKVREKTRVELKGKIVDDGLPLFGELEYKWELVSSPLASDEASTVIEEKEILRPNNTEGNEDETVTRKKYFAQFSKPGIYKFRLSANDGEKQSSDTVSVHVMPPENASPVVNLGPDRNVMLYKNNTYTFNTNSLKARVSDDKYPVKTLVHEWYLEPLDEQASEECASFAEESTPEDPKPKFLFTCPGQYTIGLRASDSVIAATDEMVLTVLPFEKNARVTPGLTPQSKLYTFTRDEKQQYMAVITDIFDYKFVSYNITYSCESENDQVCTDGIHSFESASLIPVNENVLTVPVQTETCLNDECFEHNNIQNMVLTVKLYNGTLSSPELKETLETSEITPNEPPRVNAGEDKTVETGVPFTLAAEVIDTDGPSPATSLWTLIEGPGSSVFENSSAPETQVTIHEPGKYVFKLTGTDGLITMADTVEIIAKIKESQTNISIDAGSDKAVIIEDVLRLNGSIEEYDEQKTLSYEWSVDKPDTAEIDEASALSTIARFSQEGTYIFTLTVTDGTDTVSDSFQVIVSKNQAPVIEIDTEQSTQVNTPLELSAQISDDGFPQGSQLEVTWSAETMPQNGSVTFEQNGGSTIKAIFTVAGEYLLKLLVSDSHLDSVKHIKVLVTSADFSADSLSLSTGPKIEKEDACVLMLNEIEGYSTAIWTPESVSGTFGVPPGNINKDIIGKTCIVPGKGYSFDIFIEGNAIEKIKKVELYPEGGGFGYRDRFGTLSYTGNIATIPVSDIAAGTYTMKMFDENNVQIAEIKKAIDIK